MSTKINWSNDRILESCLLGLILLWAIFVLMESYTFKPIFAWLFPTIVAIPLVILITIQVLSWRNARLRSLLARIKIDQSINIEDVDRPAELQPIIYISITTLGYVVLATFVGFFYAMPLFLIAYFYFLDCYDLKRGILITLVIWFTVSFVFGSLFSVPGVDFGPFSRINLGLFS